MLLDYPMGKGDVGRPEHPLGSAADPPDIMTSWEGHAGMSMEKALGNSLGRKNTLEKQE